MIRKKRLLNVGLLFSFLICYLEWGHTESTFIFQIEYDLFKDIRIEAFKHPLILVPLAGQLILLFSLFQKPPHKLLTFISLALLGLPVLFFFAAGILSVNAKIILSTLPFLVISVLCIICYTKKS